MSPARPKGSVFKINGERVRGAFCVSDVQPPVVAEVQAITLVSFANDLVMSVANDDNSQTRRSCSIVELKTTFFDTCPCETVEGEAFLLYRNAPISIWQTDLRSSSGAPLAQVVHTLLDRENGKERSIVADKGPPAPLPIETRSPARNADSRREIIASAACKVIAEKGFAAASIREIARAAGMHVPTMYQYVSSKEEVLELVYRWVIDRVRDNINNAFAKDSPPEDRLIGVVLSLVDNNSSMRKESGVLNREMRSLSKEARKRVVDDYAEIVDNISNIISEGIEKGHFRQANPVLMANFIDALCDIYALRYFAVGRFSIDEFKNELAKFIQFGLKEIPK